jgi:outer membrane protein OmpA-like peptidoglycan-associated protein
MNEPTRRSALVACLALGAGDLATLNISVFPRVRRAVADARRSQRAKVAVAVEGAPPVELVVAVEDGPRFQDPDQPRATSELGPAVEPAMVFFPTNVARLGIAERSQVDRLAHSAGDHGTFIVDGHADARGRERYNDRLSRQRALSVAARLLREGVPSSRIEVHAYGATRPRAGGSEPEALQRNRRVEIFLRGEAQ